MKKKKLVLFNFIILFVLLYYTQGIDAKESKKTPGGVIFEAEEKGDYYSGTPIDIFSYGRKSMGELSLMGTISSEESIQNDEEDKKYEAYGAIGNITIAYSYDGSFKSDKEEDWNLIEDGTDSINGKELPDDIDYGAIIIQKSSDTVTWKNAQDPICNYFEDNEGLKKLYSISEKDLIKGTYFRIIISYKMGRKIGDSGPFGVFDDYEYKLCTEVYEFYMYYDGNPIILRDIVSRDDISISDSVQKGFIIDKNSSSDKVTISKDSDKAEVTNFMSVNEPGDYTVDIESAVGNKYQYKIQVSDGLQFCDLFPVVYENKEKNNYKMSKALSGDTSFGLPSYTSVKIGQRYGKEIKKDKKGEFDAYGISGDRVSIFMELSRENELKNNGWKIKNDNYGQKKNEKIAGAFVGKVESGALIVQTSTDGSNWNAVDKAKYTNGLYTTNYNKNYSNKGNVCIYTPDGEELLNGIYIRVIYAYSAYNKEDDVTKKYVEEYKMYLCSDELDAVTFHNLSLEGKLDKSFGDEDENTVEMLKHAETIQSGKGTVTGFEIDTSLNPTVKYIVKKDGKEIEVPDDKRFTETGKYTIELSSEVGNKRIVDLYVDRTSDEESIKRYFGDFISGKRVFDENSKMPVYEGGETEYTIKKISDSYLPISGTIKNLWTGKSIVITSSRNERVGSLTEAGEYEATFTTNPTYSEDNESGDSRKYTFHFKIIKNGTAPGPKVNQEKLKEYATNSICDAYPFFYCLSYPSGNKGNVIIAFSSRKAAVEYSYNYEKGKVEKTSNGSYIYNGSFNKGESKEYDNYWELTAMINKCSEEAVFEKYIDLSNPDSYITLSKNYIEKKDDLHTAKLSRTIVVYADKTEKQKLTSVRDSILIAKKPHAYLSVGENGKIEDGYDDFEFVKDKYGCDSNTVKITDKNNTTYSIEYNKGVAQQLEDKKCPSGKITITESTIYGDTCNYDAYYLNSGENTAEVEAVVYKDGKEEKITITQEENGKTVEAEAFSIAVVKDEIDPYQLVVVTPKDKEPSEYIAEKKVVKSLAEEGQYEVRIVNCLGNEIKFNVNISNSDYSCISFEGEGTRNVSDILVKKGDKRIELPKLSSEGYVFEGFESINEEQYKDVIETVPDINSIVLKPIWKKKKCNIIFLDVNSNEILTQKADYNSRIELDKIDVPEGYRFIGWSYNDQRIEADSIIVDSEEMTFTPIVEEVVDDNATLTDATLTDATLTDAQPVIKKQKSSKGKWGIFVVILICVGGFALVKSKGVFSLSKGDSDDKKDETEEKNKEDD